MAINRERARQCLKTFDFRKLFIEELGWDNLSTKLLKQIDGHDYRFQAVAEKRGVVVLVSDSIPVYAIRVKVDKLIAKDYFEHLIVFTDEEHGRQVWQWVRKESGKPTAVRTYHYSSAQSGELLLQKCQTGAGERWIEARRSELLPSPYVHIVFTFPRPRQPPPPLPCRLTPTSTPLPRSIQIA